MTGLFNWQIHVGDKKEKYTVLWKFPQSTFAVKVRKLIKYEGFFFFLNKAVFIGIIIIIIILTIILITIITIFMFCAILKKIKTQLLNWRLVTVPLLCGSLERLNKSSKMSLKSLLLGRHVQQYISLNLKCMLCYRLFGEEKHVLNVTINFLIIFFEEGEGDEKVQTSWQEVKNEKKRENRRKGNALWLQTDNQVLVPSS